MNLRPRRNARSAGFTLIELLVVAGIVVLLAGLLLPMIYRSYRTASKTRLAGDLNTIGVALDAYKSDFGDYPRVPAPGTGFAILGKALVGPYDASPTASITLGGAPYKPGSVGNTGSATLNQFVALRETSAAIGPGNDWAQFAYSDGADGPGFRTRYDVTTQSGGKITPPYLQVGKFKTQGLALLDHTGNPIMYFPASPVKLNLNVSQTTARYVSSTALVPGMSVDQRTMFNFDDNGTLALSTNPNPDQQRPAQALARMQAMMGLRDPYLATAGTSNGGLKPGGTPVTVPYLLWSAGPDNIFGPLEDILTFNGDPRLIDNAVRRCDDVANIPLPQ